MMRKKMISWIMGAPEFGPDQKMTRTMTVTVPGRCSGMTEPEYGGYGHAQNKWKSINYAVKTV